MLADSAALHEGYCSILNLRTQEIFLNLAYLFILTMKISLCFVELFILRVYLLFCGIVHPQSLSFVWQLFMDSTELFIFSIEVYILTHYTFLHLVKLFGLTTQLFHPPFPCSPFFLRTLLLLLSYSPPF